MAMPDTNFGDVRFDALVSGRDFSAGDAAALMLRASSLVGDDYYVVLGATAGGQDSDWDHAGVGGGAGRR